VAWFGISYGLGQGLHFAGTIVLARLLFPEDFGIVAMATIFTSVIVQIGDFGFSEALIQRKDISTSHLSTTFWAGLAIGVIFCIVTVAASTLVATFFRNEQVGPVLAVSSLAFVIAPLRSVHGALLRKRLQFTRFSISEIGQGIAFSIIAVPMAFAGFGVWSLVLGSLASQISLVILRWSLCPWHPSIMFSFKSLRDLRGFGLNLTGSRAARSLADRLDYLIIGRFLLSGPLGFYNLAFRITSFFTTMVDMTVGRVAFPTFSIIQDNNEQLRRGFTKGLAYLSLVVFPSLAGLAIVAPELVNVVLGPRWAAAVIPIQILCVAAVFTSISVTTGPVLRSKGRPDIELKANLIKAALLVPSLLLGVRFGIMGVAVAVSMVSLIIWFTRQVLANRLISLRMRDYMACLGPAVFGTLIMVLALLAFRFVVSRWIELPDIGLLVTSVLMGATVYFLTLKVCRITAVDELIRLISELVGPLTRRVMYRGSSLEWKTIGIPRGQPEETEGERVKRYAKD
jgi:PST family polysaccharide transporter